MTRFGHVDDQKAAGFPVTAGVLTHDQKQLAFRLRARGWRLVDVAREIGCTAPMVGLMVRYGHFTTGVPDTWQPRQLHHCPSGGITGTCCDHVTY